MKFDKIALWEAVQDLGRLALFGALSAIVGYYTNQLTGADQTPTTLLVLAVLKGLDKYINENKYTKINGLTDTKIFLK